jgi:3' exoribonuclease, RNase T-like
MRQVRSKELFFSVDCETNGPYPLDYSMLSFGCAVFDTDGKLVDTFERNLELLPTAGVDASTMEWWKSQPKAWEACRKNTVPPEEALLEFVYWVKDLSKQYNAIPVMVAYPAGFDFTWMYVYMKKFVSESPFSFSCLDIKSYASAVLQLPYRDSVKRNFPKRWKDNTHNHEALTDAIGQGKQFIKMYQENNVKHPAVSAK